MRFNRFPKKTLLRARFLFVATLVAAAGVSVAQWPTSYTAPKLIGGGTNVRAGAVRANSSGGVYVAYDNIQTAGRQVELGNYNADGQQIFTNPRTYFDHKLAVRLKILSGDSTTEIRLLKQSARIEPSVEENVFYIQYIRSDGSWYSTIANKAWLIFDSIGLQEGMAAIIENIENQEVLIAQNEAVPTTGFNLGLVTHLVDGEVLQFDGYNACACYSTAGIQPGTPGKVWYMGLIYNSGSYNMTIPYKVDTSVGMSQTKPHLALLDSQNAMTTWLGEIDGHKHLYAAISSSAGLQVSTPQKCYDNVTDYVVTSSTLGLPVFAAVTRESEFPLVESLVGGLINATNGGTLTIPIVSVPGVKVKALRQEANGDFSLIYSMPENGTNLLKVRRISGVSAATLWETTVADLGWVSDDILEKFPNTWVTGNNDNVLYILARYDQPNTANSYFQLVRLRADGVMGVD